MPMPYGWGTGGVQVTAAILGPDDVLKVIDQGADDTTNAVAIRGFFEKTAGVATTTRTTEATIIQTRHRVPEAPLAEGQVLVYQVPIPEPLRFLEPRETETRKMHALEEYGLMHVKLYEDIARHGRVATTYAYPVKVEGRYVMDPSPIPKFDNPKIDNSPALQLFGAGREKRIYAIPPFTRVRSLTFEDHPFRGAGVHRACGLCAATGRLSRRGCARRSRRADVRLLRYGSLRERGGKPGARRARRSHAMTPVALTIRPADEADLPASWPFTPSRTSMPTGCWGSRTRSAARPFRQYPGLHALCRRGGRQVVGSFALLSWTISAISARPRP
jgi:alpha-D-ribose 1-methylphosphonate 5-phosphate C-P lyase